MQPPIAQISERHPPLDPAFLRTKQVKAMGTISTPNQEGTLGVHLIRGELLSTV